MSDDGEPIGEELELQVRFGRHARGLRRARGLTQAVIAELSGLSVDTIRRLEKGSFSPSLATLLRLSRGLELPLSTLFESMLEGWPADERELEIAALTQLLRRHEEVSVAALLALVRAWVSERE